MKVFNELKAAILKEDFYETNKILEKVFNEGDGLGYVDYLIRIMEENPNIDFGMPGPVVHFIERFPEMEYVDTLLNSLKRKPTSHTLWMLNRIINDPASKRKSEFIQILLKIAKKSDVDTLIRKQAEEYYKYQTEKEFRA